MESYHQLTEEPLTDFERGKLRSGLIGIPIFAVISAIIFYIMFKMVGNDEIFRYVLMGFILIFVAVIFFIFRGVVLDLRDGVKRVLVGVITKKEHTYHSGSRNSSGRHYYTLHFGDYKLNTLQYVFSAFDEGDLVELKFAKRNSSMIFSHQVLKKNALDSERLTSLNAPAKKSNYLALVLFGFFFVVMVAVIIFLFLK
jgi:hypothetical protein